MRDHGMIQQESMHSAYSTSAVQSARSSWRPSYLRRRVYLAFLLLFLVMLGAVGTLHWAIKEQQGFVVGKSHSKHLWTYGPTAALTAVATYWARVEYQAKQIAPWRAMSLGPKPIGESVLLDYISPMQPIALNRAIQNRDWRVIVCISGGIILKILIITSTALFFTAPTPVTMLNVPVTIEQSLTQAESPLQSVRGIIFEAVQARASKLSGHPDEIADGYVVPQFESNGLPPRSVIQTSLDVFSSALECEPATAVRDLSGMMMSFPQVRYSTPSCIYSDVEDENKPRVNKYYNLTDSEADIVLTYGTVRCNTTLWPDNRRLILSSVQFKKRTGEWGPQPLDRDAPILRQASYACKPTYNIQTLRVSKNVTDRMVKVAPNDESAEKTLKGVGPWDIYDAIELARADNRDPDFDDEVRPLDDYTTLDNQFMHHPLIIAAALSNSRVNLSSPLSQKSLVSLGNTFYQEMANQIAYSQFFKPNITSTNGQALIIHERLVIGSLAAILIETGLVLLALLSGGLVFFASRGETESYPRDPSRLMSLATMTANSPVFRSLLNGSGHRSLEHIKHHLRTWRFHITNHSQESSSLKIGIFKKKYAPVGRELEAEQSPYDESLTEWKPFPLNIAGKIVLVLVPAGLLAALEITLRLSAQRSGLGDVELSGYMRYSWAYIPALCMTGVGLLSASLDFASRVITPYSCLKRGVPLKVPTTAEYLDATAATTFLKSLKSRHFGITLVSLAAAIPSFLTIVIGGTFSAHRMMHSQAITMYQTTNFSSMAEDFYLRSKTPHLIGEVVELLFYGNLAYPSWTYENLAFPRLQKDLNLNPIQGPTTGVGGMKRGTTRLNLLLPALRTTLQCKTVPIIDINFSISRNETMSIDTRNHSSWDVNDRDLRTSNQFRIRAADETQCSDGDPWNVRIGNNSYFGFSMSADDRKEYSPLETCSDFRFVYGYMGETSIDHIGVLRCNETMETVTFNTSLSFPDLNIDKTNPPIAIESTADRSDVLQLQLGYKDKISNRYNLSATEYFDPFFFLLVHGSGGLVQEDFGPNGDTDRIAERIGYFHNIVRTQQVNLYTRKYLLNRDATNVSGVLTDPDHFRLVQDRASTRVLQALLATVLFCVVGAFLLQDTKVLPKNPCSIAAAASLIADSNIINALPKDAERMTNKEIEELSLFKSATFKMGWVSYDDAEGFPDNSVFTIYIDVGSESE